MDTSRHRQQPARDLLTAYHEAGHAVMAHLCGQRITRVEIVGDDEHAGSCSALRPSPVETPAADAAVPTAAIEARILCVCAGLVAEAEVSRSESWDEGRDDLDEAVRLAMKVVGDCERVIPFLEMAREHAADLLRRHWVAVEALAERLVESRVMAGAEVRKMLAAYLPE